MVDGQAHRHYYRSIYLFESIRREEYANLQCDDCPEKLVRSVIGEEYRYRQKKLTVRTRPVATETSSLSSRVPNNTLVSST